MHIQREKTWYAWFSIKDTAIICSLFLVITACQPNEKLQATEREGQEILERYRTHLCTVKRLEKETNALWEEVSKNLDARLPKDMPTDERRNMINIRNTNLIKMFEIYPLLDTSVQALVEKAGDMDNAIVVELQQARQALEEEQFRYINLLDKLEKLHADNIDQWKSRLEEVKKAPCTGD